MFATSESERGVGLLLSVGCVALQLDRKKTHVDKTMSVSVFIIGFYVDKRLIGQAAAVKRLSGGHGSLFPKPSARKRECVFVITPGLFRILHDLTLCRVEDLSDFNEERLWCIICIGDVHCDKVNAIATSAMSVSVFIVSVVIK
jgi:hypothetical protein